MAWMTKRYGKFYKAVVIVKLLCASLAWWSIRRQQTKSVSRRLFDEEFDSDCTRLTTRRQCNLPTTKTTISLAAYLPTDTTYSNSCFLTRQPQYNPRNRRHNLPLTVKTDARNLIGLHRSFIVGQCYNEIGDLTISTVKIAIMRSRLVMGQLGCSNNPLCVISG